MRALFLCAIAGLIAGDLAPYGTASVVILNLFQDNMRRPCVILKQVQDDDLENISGQKSAQKRCLGRPKPNA